MKRIAPIMLFLLLGARAVQAEVMDKELSVPDIWGHVAVLVAVAAVSAILQRWLLLASFFASVSSGLGFAWTEWHDPYVGPAIVVEAGPSYGLHIHAALVFLLLAHCLLWVAASRRAHRRLLAAGKPRPSARGEANRTLVFAAGLLTLTALSVAGGFGPSSSIWLSPPILVAALGVVVAAAAVVMGHRLALFRGNTGRPTRA